MFCKLKKIRYPKLRNLGLFYVWEDARVWTHRNHSFPRHLSYLGPVSCVFHILSSSVLTIGSGCSLLTAGLCKNSSPSWVPLGLRDSHMESQNCWWLLQPCSLLQQEYSISQHHECPSTPSHAVTSPRSSLFSHFLPSCSLCTWHLLPDFCSFVNTPGAQHSLFFFLLLGLCLPWCPVATPPSSDPYPKAAFSVGRSSFQYCHPCPPLPVLISFPAYFVS